MPDQARDVGVSSPRARGDAFDDLVSSGISPTSPLEPYAASPPMAMSPGALWRGDAQQPSNSEGAGASAFTNWCACR